MITPLYTTKTVEITFPPESTTFQGRNTSDRTEVGLNRTDRMDMVLAALRYAGVANPTVRPMSETARR